MALPAWYCFNAGKQRADLQSMMHLQQQAEFGLQQKQGDFPLTGCCRRVAVPQKRVGDLALLACSLGAHRIPFHLVCAGPPAAANRELRQARKGATVAVTLGAGMWLAQALSISARPP